MDAFNAALQVSAWGLGGIFGFMVLFYGAVRTIQRVFPADDHHHEER
jgi:hypothetical protein